MPHNLLLSIHAQSVTVRAILMHIDLHRYYRARSCDLRSHSGNPAWIEA